MRFSLRFALILVAFLSVWGRAEGDSARLPSFEKVYLVFAEEHSLEFVSGFGHAFLCLAPASAVSADDLLLCPSVNFGVDVSASGKGLFRGGYSLQPSFELVRQNSFFQQRRLFFFEIRTDTLGREGLRRELVRRLGREYPYDFVRRNCGYYLVDLLQAARPFPLVGPSILYLTPRQATQSILDAFGTNGGFAVASPGWLAERFLDAEPSAQSRSVLAKLGGSLSGARACDDARLKLLFLRMWESRASHEEYPQVIAAKQAHLETAAGKEAAYELQRAENVSFSDLHEVWPVDREGPDFAVGALVGLSQKSSLGVSIRADLGLRGNRTSPVPSGLLREVRILGLDVDLVDGRCRGEFTLAEISTVRDFSGLMGAGSSGAKVFYNERHERMSVRGLGFDVWSGLATRSAQIGWIGGKAHLVVDCLEGQTRVQFAPELFLVKEMDKATIAGSLLFVRGSQLNWEVSLDYRLTRHGPTAVVFRYESLSEVGGRIRMEWRYRY